MFGIAVANALVTARSKDARDRIRAKTREYTRDAA